MSADGLQNVRRERVMVPHWVRGAESLELVAPRFEELTQRAAEAKGKIVLYDAEWRDYGYNGAFRRQGAIAAAKAGAVASLARSAGPYGMRTPHTGNMTYDSAVKKIPHASVTAEDAMMMRCMIKRGDRVRVTLRMSARMLPDAESHNVMRELRGREKPEEIVVMGGRIESWDVGSGAMDDGGGVAYRDMHQQEKHQLAIESDGGVFSPTGIGFTGSPAARAIIEAIGGLLAPIGAGRIEASGGGADIGPIMATGVPGMGLNVDGTRYFWYHHTDADTPDKLDPAEVRRVVAAMAVMAFIAADIEQALPR